ncbi:mismatch-specific DNA-glycosylase [Patescibacteria group bacterium AH-259-L05]|nr:mismatch-specific DNA-glycosylase [Patescibacteria group bacterium AH-259-L05]
MSKGKNKQYGLPPIIKKGLDILFVDINPHIKSIQNGHYFSSQPNHPFWKQLHLAGLTDTQIDDTELLDYNYGITDIVERAIRSSDGVPQYEFFKGCGTLRARIKKHKPKVVCFIGKRVFQEFFGVPAREYGWQDINMGSSRVFVMVFPIATPISLDERLKILQRLKKEI